MSTCVKGWNWQHYTKGCCKWLQWLWQEFGVGWISENHSRFALKLCVGCYVKRLILHYVELIEIIMLIVFENFVTKKYACRKDL
jgi:hypothetical protein